ncbi:xanthine dehydrogenase YagS FAD-binding subunit [Thermocatellispora tengchongensis]|uniref:Xanthine dehydrogenase YagS FAD-binding subunit n=1 Tax=Thermocatellispora tengchongensis TaxID=1073253 RepID=A0A840NUF4_9ACTN|nr:xanthine dehydrogenase family protein subunit M [Thermocatellispora tengchongensis]MBB5132374.1 xanthine dehydrogenase YagS FAD-binding subunit [Thermocatellispora tengchongensis]
MRPYTYAAPGTVREALALAGDGSAYLAGGTTLVDLVKLEVMTPEHVLDITRLPLRGVAVRDGALRIGALERMADVAEHPLVAGPYPVLAEALLRSASPQIRNMATIGGNLLQRTRCGYFRDTASACNKRVPGSGCPALTGENRMHAILGTSDACAATHPSDLAVALVALDASVHLASRDGERSVKLADFYLLPGGTPEKENALRPGELITSVSVPALAWAERSTYVKVRDRSSYEFALTSAAVALDLRDGVVRAARVAAGGVGTRPWRLPAVEAALTGAPAREDAFEAAAAKAADGARPLAHNAFKPELLRRTVVRALLELAGRS